MTTSVDELAATVAKLQRQVSALARGSQAAFRSVDLADGPVEYYDETGTTRLVLGATDADPDSGVFTITEVNGPTPPTPTIPDLAPVQGGINIIYDGTYVESNPPGDLWHVEIHVSSVSGFTPDDTTQVAVFTSLSGGEYVYPVDHYAGVRYVKLVAVTNSGQESTPSDEASATALIVQGQPDGVVPGQVTSVIVDGGVRSLFVTWLAVANADLVTYKIYGGTNPGVPIDTTHLVGKAAANRFTAYQIWDDSAGAVVTSLVPGIPYYIRVVAEDADGPGTASAEASGTPIQITGPDIASNSVATNHLQANSVDADILSANLIMASETYWGDRMSIIPSGPNNGLRIRLDNGVIALPTDGTQARVDAGIVAKTLTVENNLDIHGTINKISGEINLASGVAAPTLVPSAAVDWSNSSTYWNTSAPIGTLSSFWHLTGGGFLETERVYGGVVFVIGENDPVRYPVVNLPSNVNPVSAIQIGTNYLVSVIDGTRSNAKYIFTYNAAGVKTAEKLITNSTSWVDGFILDYDGTYVYYAARLSTTNKVRIHRANAGTLALIDYCDTTTPFGAVLTGLYVGAADLGAQRIFLAYSLAVQVHGPNFANTGTAVTTRYAADDWSRAGSDNIAGLGWDGIRFFQLGATGRVWRFSKQIDVTARPIGFSYFDSDSTGGQHETEQGPTVNILPTKRAWHRIDGYAPPDQGGTDDPDSIRFYISNHRQAALAAGVTSALFDQFDLTGAASQVSNGFASLSNAIGVLKSAASDGSGQIIKLNGTGNGRVGPLAWDAAGKQTSKVPYARLSANAAQTLTASVETTVALPTVALDTTGGAMTGTANTITITLAGRYQIRLVSSYNAGVGGSRITLLYKNGAALERWAYPVNSANTSAAFGVSEVTEQVLSVGDTLYYREYDSAASPATGYASAYIPTLEAEWVSPS